MTIDHNEYSILLNVINLIRVILFDFGLYCSEKRNTYHTQNLSYTKHKL